MAAVQNSDVFFFPFHARLKAQPNIRPAPLGDVNGRWTAWRRSDCFHAEMIPEPDYSESEEETSSEEESDEDVERSRSSEEDERLRGLDEENENEEDARKRVVPAPSDPKKVKGASEKDDNHSTKTFHKFPEDSMQKIKSGTAPRLKKSQSLEEGLIKPKKPFNPNLESSERKNLYKELKFKQKHGTSIKNQKSELQKALEKYSESRVKKELAVSRRTSLEKILEQQALKLELQERHGTDDNLVWVDRLQRQHVPRLVNPRTDEFFRVHARVVSQLMMDESSSSSSSILTESDS